MAYLEAFGEGLARGAGELAAFILAGLIIIHVYRTWVAK